MVSPKELYLEKRNMVYELYQSKLSSVGLASSGAFGSILQSEVQSQSAATAAESSYEGDGYDAYLEIEALNRGYRTMPGYATGINATDSQRAISLEKSQAYTALIDEIGAQYGVPPSLIKAVIQTESSFNADAVSSAGAEGLMQLMPGTANGLGVADSFDPRENIEGGVKYLRQQMDRFGDVRLALAAYNKGPGRVSSLEVGNVNDMTEYAKLPDSVQRYIENVMHFERQYAAL